MAGSRARPKRLSLTQPAVSDHVRKLEESYGVQLFNRGPSGVALTAMGRSLFAIAERLFEAETEARDLLSRAQTLEEGQLTIGADAAVHILPRVARFRAAFPGIAVRLVTGNSAELLARLEAFAIDVAIVADRPSDERFVVRRLREDRLVAVVPGQGDKAARTTLDALMNRPMILREEGSVTRRLLTDETAPPRPEARRHHRDRGPRGGARGGGAGPGGRHHVGGRAYDRHAAAQPCHIGLVGGHVGMAHRPEIPRRPACHPLLPRHAGSVWPSCTSQG